MNKATARQCERFWELSDAKASGTELSAAERSWLDSHASQCEECALERRLAGLVGTPDSPGPAPEMDELARHRWAGQVIERREREASDAEDPRPIMQHQRRPRWPLMAIAGLATAAGLAALVLWQPTEQPPSRAPSWQVARLFITSGTVQGRLGTLRAGDLLRLADGEQVHVDRGMAAFSFCGGAEVFVSEQTRVAVQPATPDRCGLALSGGRVVVRIAKLPQGVRLEVASGKTTVQALGTVFAVEAEPKTTDVRVLRGAVRVDVTGAPSRRLTTMEGMRGRKVRRLQGSEANRDWQLATASDAGSMGTVVLDIASVPSGARVAIDGKPLGRTPVTAMIKAGQRQLELHPPTGSVLREIVELKPGDRFTRVYTLAADGGAGAADAAPADASAQRVRPVRRKLTARALLDRARAHRAKRQWKAAANAYRQLLRRYPKSSEGKAALVAYGQILLDRLHRARQALAVFERYLKQAKTGPLVEEAAWHKIRALRRLARRADERAALQRFVRDHPSSLNASRARRRLIELSKKPQR